MDYSYSLMIFRTDISSKKEVQLLNNILADAPHILEWTIDLEDIDNVFRVRSNKMTEQDIIELGRDHNFKIEMLPD